LWFNSNTAQKEDSWAFSKKETVRGSFSLITFFCFKKNGAKN